MAKSVQEIAERLNHEAELRHMPTSALIDELAAQLDRPKRRSLGFVDPGTGQQ